MSFDVMRPRPEVASHPLRIDWSREEERFRVGLDEYRKSIAISNALLENPPYTYASEKISAPEVVADKGVSSEPKNNPKIVQDERTQSVECNGVQGPYVGSSTPQPARPTQQESVLSMPAIDPFDDIASTNSTTTKASDDLFDFTEKSITQPVAVEQKPALQPTAQTQTVDVFDEFVAPSDSSPTPAAIPAIQQPSPVETLIPSVSTPAAEPAQPAKLAEVPPSAAVADIPKPKKSAALKPHGEACPAEDALVGFDADRFERVKATVAEMLQGAPDVDLDKLLNSLGEYSVNLDLDYLRENPHVVTDKLLEVQAKRDSLHAQILRLSPLVVSMRHASDYFDKVGTMCADPNLSKDKRVAQVYFIISDFLIRASKVDRTNTNVEHTYKHLADQYEMISRLITGFQYKAKGEISRGEMPFDPPYKVVPAAGKIQVLPPAEAAKPTLVAKATGAPPKDEVEDKLLSRELSQPISAKKFENLDSFDSGSKPAKNTTSRSVNSGTVESDW